MAKKSYLVTFTATTRVIADAPENATPDKIDKLFEDCLMKAKKRILNNGVGDYLSMDNADICEDTECPYGTFAEDLTV